MYLITGGSAVVELQGLDPYSGCLHQTSDRHAALVSDLIEEFRTPIVDSLVLYSGFQVYGGHFRY